MSETPDTHFAADERARLLNEVRAYLPGFLGSAARLGRAPIDVIDDLLGLQPSDLQRVTAVHVLLSEPVQRFVDALPHGLRRPATTTERPPVATQAVRGGIDWGATTRARAQRGWDQGVYVVRSAERKFETPENQALAWVLRELDAMSLRAVGTSDTSNRGGALGRIAETRAKLDATRRFGWLRAVEPARPTRRTLRRLAASRRSFYREDLRATWAVLERYVDPREEDLVELLTQRFFEPERDWQLFEIVVALRLARAFVGVGSPDPTGLLVGSVSSRRAFASYRLADGDVVSLWYQAWPPGGGRSEHGAARETHGVAAGASRPDLVITRRGPHPDAVVLELKATRHAGYLGSGLSQLLGYIAEWPARFGPAPAGWLVAPASQAFRDAPAGANAVWVVSADSVADAAVRRFVPQQLQSRR